MNVFPPKEKARMTESNQRRRNQRKRGVDASQEGSFLHCKKH